MSGGDVRTLREWVPDDFDGDSAALAGDILRELLRHPRLARAVLYPLVLAHVDAVLRTRVRITEAEVIPSIRKHGARVFRPALDRKAMYLRMKFALGDGTEVTWGDATVDQHLARIAMLERQVAGVSQTIERHRYAVDAIRKAGVSCLADLPNEEVAA